MNDQGSHANGVSHVAPPPSTTPSSIPPTSSAPVSDPSNSTIVPEAIPSSESAASPSTPQDSGPSSRSQRDQDSSTFAGAAAAESENVSADVSSPRATADGTAEALAPSQASSEPSISPSKLTNDTLATSQGHQSPSQTFATTTNISPTLPGTTTAEAPVEDRSQLPTSVNAAGDDTATNRVAKANGQLGDLKNEDAASAPVLQSTKPKVDQEAELEPRAIKITPAQIKFAQNSIKALKSRREAQPFLQPVDPIAQGVPHYPQVIAHPMDLGTVDIKLALTALAVKPGGKPGEKAKQAPQWGLDPERDFYASVEEFESDVLLIFSNCALFNGKESPYTANAMVLQAAFERHMKDIPSAAAPAAPPATIIREAVAGEPKRESRRPSNPVPTIRRSSSDAGGRPKREIHPPPPKDLPWATEPASATVSGSKKMQGKKGSKKGGVLTPREQAHYAKIAQDELKFCARVVEELLKSHYNDAWVFEELPTRDYDWAPAYYEIIKNPVALGPVQRNLKANKYPDAASFDADIQQMFSNCFTFNPPGSDVYLMGERLKKVYDEKMSRKPIPPAYSPEPEYTSEDDDNEDDDVDSEFIKKLGQQIADMQETLAKLEGAKNQNHDLIANTKAMLAAFQANYASSKPEKKSKGAKRKGVPDGGLVGQGSSKKKAKSKVSGNSSQDDTYQAKKSKPAASKAPQKKKSSGGGTSSKKSSASKRNAGSDDEIRTVTYEQKEELAAKITELSEERLDGAIRIINEDKPPNQSEEEEIELDIDELSPRTLYKLYKYVVRPSKKPSASASANKGNGRNSAPLDGRKRGTGGLKKKNLDEGEEAERIARLQQQLEQFGNHDGGIPGSSAPAGIHDDLVQSESSSDGESGSDSESD